MSSMITLVCPSCLHAKIRVHRDDLDKLPNPWLCERCEDEKRGEALWARERERKQQEAYQAGGE